MQQARPTTRGLYRQTDLWEERKRGGGEGERRRRERHAHDRRARPHILSSHVASHHLPTASDWLHAVGVIGEPANLNEFSKEHKVQPSLIRSIALQSEVGRGQSSLF